MTKPVAPGSRPSAGLTLLAPSPLPHGVNKSPLFGRALRSSQVQVGNYGGRLRPMGSLGSEGSPEEGAPIHPMTTSQRRLGLLVVPKWRICELLSIFLVCPTGMDPI